MTSPVTPARLSWTTEIWPTKPVITISESAITAPISLLTRAWRKSNGSTISATAHATASGTAMLARRLGRGTSGKPRSTSWPRPGSRAPRRYIAAMMISRVRRSGTPGIGAPAVVGNHDIEDIQVISENSTPMPKPAAHATVIEVRPASSAAASAGTICSGSVFVSSSVIAAAMIPTIPAIRAAISELVSASFVGESPRSMPEISFSDVARVATPKRDHL